MYVAVCMWACGCVLLARMCVCVCVFVCVCARVFWGSGASPAAFAVPLQQPWHRPAMESCM